MDDQTGSTLFRVGWRGRLRQLLPADAATAAITSQIRCERCGGVIDADEDECVAVSVYERGRVGMAHIGCL